MFKSLNTLSGDSFACLDFVDLGFDDIMGEETAADPPPLEKEDHDDMSQETEDEGDIISDIERIQRALTGNIRDCKKGISKPPLSSHSRSSSNIRCQVLYSDRTKYPKITDMFKV